LLPITKEQPHAMSLLWERMSNAKVKDADATGTGRFVRALYDNCGKISQDEV